MGRWRRPKDPVGRTASRICAGLSHGASAERAEAEISDEGFVGRTAAEQAANIARYAHAVSIALRW